MGKMAAYLGPPIPTASLLEHGVLSLVRQGADHADGFGLGWYPADGGKEPLAIASPSVFGRDAQLSRLARRLTSSCVMARLEKLDPSEPAITHAQPFCHGPYLFLHEGELTRFREVFERPLRNRLSDSAHRLVQAGTASDILFAMWLDALGDRTGPEAMAEALESMVNTVREVAVASDTAAHFGIVVSDGSTLVTLRTATQGTPPPMFTIIADDGAPFPKTGRVIATEPIFPGAWSSLDPHSLVIFTTE